MKVGSYPISTLYGDGQSSDKIITILDNLQISVKREFSIID